MVRTRGLPDSHDDDAGHRYRDGFSAQSEICDIGRLPSSDAMTTYAGLTSSRYHSGEKE